MNQSDFDNVIKPKLFALADALEMHIDIAGHKFTGTRKQVLELFNGYSPTIISSIENTLIDEINEVVAAQGQIWGNVGFVIVVERTRCKVSFFLYDRSKIPVGAAWDTNWSRKRLYHWLGGCCVAIYHRSMFDTVWQPLDKGKQRLAAYNQSRDDGVTARHAYEQVWGAE